MQVVIRSLSVLTLLAHHPEGLTLKDIAEAQSLAPATAHRILAVLDEQSFVTRSASSRRYFLGPAARELSSGESRRLPGLTTTHPAVTAAGRKTGETVFVCELVDAQAVCISLVESRHPLRLFVRVGQPMPLHAAASARVLIAWHAEDDVRRILSDAELTAYTPETPSTVNQVLEHLALIRERGYDVCHSELDRNVWAVSAPVRSSADEVVASVTLAAPAQRVDAADDQTAAINAVQEAAAAISSDLGWAAEQSR
ncbi:IclR family transcriptional regulator [Microbacterium protaetiae]|uniref:IclR family transcriptional regulator n=1 Tax=Microbacterium protaetiae TaxID=2509458 RepID=A0A4P6E910_9MICO|nr:IclR family transcriptional regulator [Microbacterium protaetiae]QAY58560.1 IclR family transcriptional regulator [Microbacterium protaetiae]